MRISDWSSDVCSSDLCGLRWSFIMKTIVRNPTSGIYPATDDYVHALEVCGAERLLLVSGTMGLDAAGTPGTTLEQQLALIWSNIRTILASADMTLDNVLRLTSYLTARPPWRAGDSAHAPFRSSAAAH